jgi:hypothetical protein
MPEKMIRRVDFDRHKWYVKVTILFDDYSSHEVVYGNTKDGIVECDTVEDYLDKVMG